MAESVTMAGGFNAIRGGYFHIDSFIFPGGGFSVPCANDHALGMATTAPPS